MQNFNPIRQAAFSVPAVGADSTGPIAEIRVGVCVPFSTGDISILFQINTKATACEAKPCKIFTEPL